MEQSEKRALLGAPMDKKLERTKMLIIEWYEQFEGNVYVAFSGGKDSTVLLHIVRSLYPDVVGVFANTGLEYPEIVKFVKAQENVEIIKPKLSFKQALDKYGYPIVSKEQSQYLSQYMNARDNDGSKKTMNTRWNGNKWGRGKISEKWKFLVKADFKITDKCCDTFKKDPFKVYEKNTGKKGILGVMAGESSQRAMYYYKEECNAFSAKRPLSKPIFFWNEDDIWKYMRDFKVEYSDIYKEEKGFGYDRTGCMFCMYGLHAQQKQVEKGEIEKDRFERMKETHPKLYKYCMDKLGLRKVIKAYTGRDYDEDNKE